MAHVRKDTLVTPLEWAKHLKPFGKRHLSGRERQAAKKQIRKCLHDTDGDGNCPKPTCPVCHPENMP